MDGLDMLWVRWLFEHRLPSGQRPAFRRRRSGSRSPYRRAKAPCGCEDAPLEGAVRAESAQARAAQCMTCLGLETWGYGREGGRDMAPNTLDGGCLKATRGGAPLATACMMQRGSRCALPRARECGEAALPHAPRRQRYPPLKGGEG